MRNAGPIANAVVEAFPGAQVVGIREKKGARTERAPYALRKRFQRARHVRYDQRPRPVGGLKSVSSHPVDDVIWGDHTALHSACAYYAEAEYRLRLIEYSEESEEAEVEA